jgi:hypothetical protein
MDEKQWTRMQDAMERKTPTNGEAARRPYCAKHHRAKIDIGGEKKCPDCVKEKTNASP